MEQREDRALLLSLVAFVTLLGLLLYLIWVIADLTPLPALAFLPSSRWAETVCFRRKDASDPYG